MAAARTSGVPSQPEARPAMERYGVRSQMLVSAACGNKSTTNVVTSNEIATSSSNYDLYYYYYDYKGFFVSNKRLDQNGFDVFGRVLRYPKQRSPQTFLSILI